MGDGTGEDVFYLADALHEEVEELPADLDVIGIFAALCQGWGYWDAVLLLGDRRDVDARPSLGQGLSEVEEVVISSSDVVGPQVIAA